MRWFAPRKPLSAHFSWDEVIRNSGYDRVPLGPLYVGRGRIVFPRRNARKQARYMERLRTAINAERVARQMVVTGISTISWARSPRHNRLVHGAPDSRHLYFDACDISVQEIERLCPWTGGRKAFDVAASHVFENGGFGTYPAGNRHVDSRGYRARWSSFVGL